MAWSLGAIAVKFSLHGIRRYGRVAAFLAVYALVLNTMLTSALSASISPAQFSAVHELCFAGGATAPATDTDDRTTSPIRCPLCLSPTIAIGLPPVSPAIAVRPAVYTAITFVQRDVFVAQSEGSHRLARGPPALG